MQALTESHADFRAAALCGSWARGNPHEDSDLDFLIIVEDPAALRRRQKWLPELDFTITGFSYVGHTTATYGVVWSAHIDLEPRGEIELAFANETWARLTPLDPGTRHVVTDAFRILADKDGHFFRLQEACAKSVWGQKAGNCLRASPQP